MKKLKNWLQKILSKSDKVDYTTNKGGAGLYRNEDFRGFVISRNNKNHFVIDYDLLYRVQGKMFDKIEMPDINETQKAFNEADENRKIAMQDWMNAGYPNIVSSNKSIIKDISGKDPLPSPPPIATEKELLKFISHNNRNRSGILKSGLPSNYGILKLSDFKPFEVSVKEYDTHLSKFHDMRMESMQKNG